MQKPVRGVTAAATYALVDTAVVTNQSTSQQFQPGQPLLRRPKHSGTDPRDVRLRPGDRERQRAPRRPAVRQQLPVAAHDSE